MDLTSLMPAREGIFLQFLHPVSGKPLYMQKDLIDEDSGEPVVGDDGSPVKIDNLDEPIGLYVVGMDSEEYAARERWLLDQRLERAEAATKTGKPARTSAEDVQKESLNAMIACIKGYRNIWYEGTELNFSTQTAKLLLTKFRWIRDFLDRELANRANFIKG